ncbi:hypothetical protein ACFPPA_14075 [Rhodanobacter ginsengisoli]|uniref:Uncharacterized protein n=1 Tax=Rhodanobacter ginsengisoli TaxID=418646 RepID=A0ABW0QRE2_9GAMM
MTKHRANDTTGESEMEIEYSVLEYLYRHPQAADTLRGIVDWWLPQQRYESDSLRIEHVLGRLVAQGRLHCDRLPGGEVLYALDEHTRSPQPH